MKTDRLLTALAIGTTGLWALWGGHIGPAMCCVMVLVGIGSDRG